jgi:membrane protein required for beta-lactamase induction
MYIFFWLIVVGVVAWLAPAIEAAWESWSTYDQRHSQKRYRD